MDHHERRGARAGRFPMGLLGMAAWVVAVESFVASRPARFTETSTYSWTLSAAAARSEAASAEVLCFGDSLVKHGLLPEVLRDRLGGPVYNLSVCAAPAPAHYYLLEHAIDAGARPRAIVVDFMPGLLAGTPRDAERSWCELLDVGEVAELARIARDGRFLAAATLDRLLPTVRSRWEIRADIVAAFGGEAAPLLATNRTHRRNWGVHLGAQFTPDNPAFRDEPTEADHRRLLSDHFWCHRINRTYIDRFLDLATSTGVRVYWLLPPASPAVTARRVAAGADAKHTAFVREMVARHPGVVVLDARRSGYDGSKFVDPIHLTGRGALALSAVVAEAIGSSPSVAWVDLPPYRDAPRRGPFEDVDQSRGAELAGAPPERR